MKRSPFLLEILVWEYSISMIVPLRCTARVHETSLYVKVFATKPDNLSPIPGTYIVEEKYWLPQTVI